MRRARVLLAVCAVAGAVSPAAAQSLPDEAFYPRVSAGIGLGGRVSDIAGLSLDGADVHGELAYRLTPVVFALATFDAAWVHDRDPMLVAPVSGTVTVPAIGVRHVLMSFGATPGAIGGDLVFELALGRETTRWDGGGRLSRTVVGLGFGGSMSLPARSTLQRIRYGFRLDFARAPDPGKVPYACDGPCDTLTKTRPYDTSMTLEIAWLFGR